MKLLLALALVGVALAERLSSPTFDSFMATHGKVYESEVEHNVRYWTFFKNMAKWELLQKSEQGSATYGPTQFADLSEEEFKAQYLSPVTSKDMFYLGMMPKAAELDTTKMADSVDWVAKGAVTEVKNQGMCGSCWAFSTTGNVEGRWFVKNNKLVDLSEQELVDCDKVDMGCNGGLPYQAYAEIMRLGGLVAEEDYPYTGKEGKCSLDKSKIVATVSGREHVSTDEAQIAAYVSQNGPVSIGLNAAAMQFYTGGVSHPWSFMCSPSGIDHGVLIAGYGTENGTPYWLIKNSWGTGWGEKGYYKLYRGDGSCGCNQMVTSATV